MIRTMPTYLGVQLYPNGWPLPAKSVKFKGKSMEDIFLSIGNPKSPPSNEEIKILNDYRKYYILAPCFHLEGYTAEYVINADDDKLFDIMLDTGIDPI